jgi:hypothetical protein
MSAALPSLGTPDSNDIMSSALLSPRQPSARWHKQPPCAPLQRIHPQSRALVFVSSNDELIANEDGSIDIYIGHDEPPGMASNWIETIPGSDIFIGIRVYGPAEEMLNGEYRMPRFAVVD